MLVGAPHDAPLNVTALPPLSTAAQNEDDGQDTEVRPLTPSMLPAALQEPLKVKAFPALSTAAQNDADAQDTEVR